MPAYPQKRATNGSQYWIQTLVQENSELINEPIAKACDVEAKDVVWYSPLAADSWAEHRDQSFIDTLRVVTERQKLADFWPARGPQWDALGTAGAQPLLCEAKAHLPEMLSPACGASLKSRTQITRSFLRVQLDLNIACKIDWLGVGYQYVNRLAHLYFLREVNQIPAHLIFLYFCNDPTLKNPANADEWKGAVRLFESLMGTSSHRLRRFVHHIHVDLTDQAIR